MLNIEVLFDDIYARYYPAILRYAIAKEVPRETAEEIAHETFERLWRKRAECRFENEAALYVWIYKAAGLILQEVNRKAAEEVELTDCEHYIADKNGIDEQIEGIQYEQYLSEIRKRLSESEWLLFQRIFIEKRPYAEISREIGKPSVTMRSNISRLRKKLRPFIAEILEKTK